MNSDRPQGQTAPVPPASACKPRALTVSSQTLRNFTSTKGVGETPHGEAMAGSSSAQLAMRDCKQPFLCPRMGRMQWQYGLRQHPLGGLALVTSRAENWIPNIHPPPDTLQLELPPTLQLGWSSQGRCGAASESSAPHHPPVEGIVQEGFVKSIDLLSEVHVLQITARNH